MKRMGCKQEIGVVRAWQTGEWTEQLRLHVAGCGDCREALHLAEVLQSVARRAEARFNPPDANWAFERSRRKGREIAVRRMARLLATMRALAAVYVVAAAGWLLRSYATLQFREVTSEMHGAFNGFALMGATVAAVFVVAGLWPIFREGAGTRAGR